MNIRLGHSETGSWDNNITGIWEKVRWNFVRTGISSGLLKISLTRKGKVVSLCPILQILVKKTKPFLLLLQKQTYFLCFSYDFSIQCVPYYFLVFSNRLKWSVLHLEPWAEQYQSSFRSQYFHSGQSGARWELRASFRHRWANMGERAAGGSSRRIRLDLLFKESESNKQSRPCPRESQTSSYFFYVSVIFFKPQREIIKKKNPVISWSVFCWGLKHYHFPTRGQVSYIGSQRSLVWHYCALDEGGNLQDRIFLLLEWVCISLPSLFEAFEGCKTVWNWNQLKTQSESD